MHIEVSPFNGRRIMKHQEDASDSQNEKEKARDPSEAEGIGESETMAFHFHREDVKEEIVIHQHRSFQIRIGYSGSEDGTPKCRT